MYKPRFAFLLHKLKTIELQDLHEPIMQHVIGPIDKHIAVWKKKFDVSLLELLQLTLLLKNGCDEISFDRGPSDKKVSIGYYKVLKNEDVIVKDPYGRRAWLFCYWF